MIFQVASSRKEDYLIEKGARRVEGVTLGIKGFSPGFGGARLSASQENPLFSRRMKMFPIPWEARSDAGVFLFNQGEYWCAHEAWEGIWMHAEPVPKKFYQGLIQIAAGYVKLQQRHHKGALANLKKGLERFREVDEAVGDLDVPILYKKLVNQSRGVRVSLLDQGEGRVLARAWDLWPKIEYAADAKQKKVSQAAGQRI